MKAFISICTLICSLALGMNAQASDLGDFSGRYEVKVSGLFNFDTVDFSVNRVGDITVHKYTGDESLGIPQLNWHVSEQRSPYGPGALPLATLTVVVGSDEETHSFLIRLAHTGFDANGIEVLDGLYTINDRVNDYTEASRFKPTMKLWNGEESKFEPLPGTSAQ